ncbi:uncharacterized protein QYS62_002621 [Fusarium acuminatum]|uniref:Uncharacterized protein n=1 Tax=Fusarium acuminatum TaxID=5515 RepID=A0ABZ2WM96_9HYPO
MPGPPTPVSVCPLIYLEIRDGASARAYSSCRPHDVFTLTIEGERPIDAKMGTLIILIHRGVQQVVSVRLSEMNRVSRPPENIVSINKQVNGMCVRIPGMSQAILVQFEKMRDFSVAVCLLQKAGFYISDTMPVSLLTHPSRTDPNTLHPTVNFGPRLSSITPLSLLPTNEFRGAMAQPDLSFTTILDTPFQSPPLTSTPFSQALRPQITHSRPIEPHATSNHAAAIATQLNPYNMFLERGNTHPYIPRVSSPLRHSFDSGSPQMQRPYETAEARSCGDMLTLGPSLHSPVIKRQGVSIPENSQRSTASSHHGAADLRKELSPGPYSYQLPQEESHEFRNLMPRPRKLPFESNTKHSTPGGRLEGQGNIPTDNKTAPKPRNYLGSLGSPIKQRVVNPGKLSTPNHPSSIDEGAALRKSAFITGTAQRPKRGDQGPVSMTTPTGRKPKEDTYRDANCQTEDTGAVQDNPGGPLEVSDLNSHCLNLDIAPCVVVTDPDMLKELNQATATLFEQYEKDIAGGGEKEQHAEFYLDQIWTRRRDFWLEKLQTTRG